MDKNEAKTADTLHPYRLGRQFSLGRNKYYKIVYRRGKSFPGRSMVLIYLKDKQLRVGFSASGKVGGAVTRNRIRRWMREDFRMIRKDVKPGRYVFAARMFAAKASHAFITREMRALIVRAGLWQGEDDAR